MKINSISNRKTVLNFSSVAKQSVLTKEEQLWLQNYKNGINKKSPVYNGIKRFIDITHGALGLIIAAPVLLLSIAAIRAESKGSPFFKQERLGKDGKPFTIYKLRTMFKEEKDNDFDIKSGEDEHITKVGKFLRKYSIDEFPQFLNIIKGDMSLIGPRPISERTHKNRSVFDGYLARYAVKPGASLPYKNVKCSNNIDTINVEKNYVENRNLKIDFKIFLNIFSTVFGGKNY